MTLPASPPITLAQVRAEFGAPAGTSLHAFVRGGAWVPNTSQNSGVPAAPPIRLAQLCGAANYTPVSASASPSSASGSNSTNVAGTYTVTTNSVTGIGSNGNGTYTYSWSIVSGTGITISSPNAATTHFSASLTVNNINGSQTKTGTARCTISDGTTSAHVDVPVSITMNWTGGA